MLTPKQEAFARAVALDDMNYSDAYRSAYNAERMKDETVYTKSSILAKDGKIAERIAELRGQANTPRVMSAQQRREKLSELAAHEDPNVSMKAIDLLNKMTGEYVQKVEAQVQNEVLINIDLVDDEE
jgi:hypothetical protein